MAAFPNTYAVYVQALTHLRDLYAPNVILGLEVSQWATGNDIGLDSNPSTNITALGQEVGTFLSKAGPHDLLFTIRSTVTRARTKSCTDRIGGGIDWT